MQQRGNEPTMKMQLLNKTIYDKIAALFNNVYAP